MIILQNTRLGITTLELLLNMVSVPTLKIVLLLGTGIKIIVKEESDE